MRGATTCAGSTAAPPRPPSGSLGACVGRLGFAKRPGSCYVSMVRNTGVVLYASYKAVEVISDLEWSAFGQNLPTPQCTSIKRASGLYWMAFRVSERIAVERGDDRTRVGAQVESNVQP